MTHKYDFRVIQVADSWKAEITRRATAKKTVVSKQQDGFASEEEAREWGERELKALLETLAQRRKLKG